MRLSFDVSLAQVDKSNWPKNCEQGFTESVSMYVNVAVVSNQLPELEKIGLRTEKHCRKMPSQKKFKQKAKRFHQLPIFP